MKKILITGAAGFGASGLIRELLKDPQMEITGLDIIGRNHATLLTDEELDKIEWIWKSVHDIEPEDINHDIIVHLAAQADVPMGLTSPRWTVWENVDGAVALLEAVRKKKERLTKLIYAGSGNEWGRPLYVPIDENHPLTPHNPYAFSKAAAELAFWSYHRCYNLPITIMSNGIVCGPGMRKEIFIYKWFKNLLRGKPLVLEGGDQTRDITYVSDVVDAWKRVIYSEPNLINGHKFQVSYGKEYSIETILLWCLEIAAKDGYNPVDIIHKPHRPGEQGQREVFTNKKAREMLGYDPQINPYMAVELTWKWMREEWEKSRQ